MFWEVCLPLYSVALFARQHFFILYIQYRVVMFLRAIRLLVKKNPKKNSVSYWGKP